MRIHLYIALILLLLSPSLAAQQPLYGDTILAMKAPDSVRLRLVSEWIKANAPNMREPILRIANAALTLAQTTENPAFISGAVCDLGNVYFFQERMNDARESYEKALELALQSGQDIPIIRAYRGLMRYYQNIGDYVKTIEYIQKIEQRLSKVQDKGLIGGCYNLFCGIYASLGRWNDVERIARIGIQFNMANQLVMQIPSSYYHLGKTMEIKNQLDSAIYYMQKAREGYASINNQEELAGMTMQIAKIMFKKGKNEIAIQEMSNAMQMVENNRDTAGIAFVSMEFGKMLLQLSRVPEAGKYLLRSQQISEKLRMTPELKMVYVSLSEYFEKSGDIRNALLFYKKYTALKDTIEGAETQQKIAELDARFENSKKEQRISELNSQNNNQRLQIYLLAAVLALLALGLTAGFLLVRNRQRKSIIREQQFWASQIVASTENERRRIASDLHDGIAQQLAAIKMFAAGLARMLEGTPREQANILLSEIDKAGREVRQLSHQMMPRSLNDLGLSAAVEDLFWISFSQTDMQFEAHTSDYQAPPDSARDTALYRIAQEAVNNILKHSGATQVHLTLRSDTTQIQMTIQDNGKGFSSNHSDSLGMQSMASRSRLHHGSFQVHSSPGAGTTIEVAIPLGHA